MYCRLASVLLPHPLGSGIIGMHHLANSHIESYQNTLLSASPGNWWLAVMTGGPLVEIDDTLMNLFAFPARVSH